MIIFECINTISKSGKPGIHTILVDDGDSIQGEAMVTKFVVHSTKKTQTNMI